MEQVKIEKNIPMPRRQSTKYLFADKIDVNDSFFIGVKNEKETHRHMLKWLSGVKRINKKYKFKGRSVEGGFRIWRVK